MSLSITFPNRGGSGDPEKIDFSGNIVLIGANGSGKTRLGIWIEQQNQKQYTVHRISAQKALAIPDYAELKSLEQAEKDLILGTFQPHASVDRKIHDRWGSNPATWLLNDYNKLLSLLFAKSAERDRKHTQETRVSECYIPVPDSPIDIIVKIWADIMPHREIKFADGKVLVNKIDESQYHGKEMSDGERIALYLIGQCLCAPDHSIIIVDTPEMHLHKSLLDKLWNSIEELGQTKTIIYITHDLDFASSRVDATKIWVKSYSGNSAWTWAEVPVDDALPESMILEVIGSRKKILFCEGETGGLDSTIYQIVYSRHVIPRGGCANVIESTKALRNNPSLHHLDAVGITDSDYKGPKEISALESQGIHTIAVAEIENLLCVEPALRIMAEHLGKDANVVISDVTAYIQSALKGELELQISSMAEKQIQYLLGAFCKTSNDKLGLSDGLKASLARVDIEEIHAQCKSVFDTAIKAGNLDDLLRVYNRKSLPTQISKFFGLAPGEYQELLLRLMKGPKRQSIVSALAHYMPKIP